jgi:pSer/pThr/pTyr-binding forkhead associated (FHA) protein
MPQPTAGSPTAQQIAVVRHSGRELCLGPGRYFIGRAPASDILINNPLASRLHARLTVSTRSVTIEDLGSSNGVGVNGKRTRGSCELSLGDVVSIGGEEIELVEFGLAPELACTVLDQDQILKPKAQARASDAVITTHRGDGFELVGSMAERAFANHRPQDAANILRHRLAAVLSEAKQGRSLEPRRSAAIEYACRLAIALHDGKWVDYVFELLICQSTPCPDAQTDLLRSAIENVTRFDLQLLERYAEALRGLPQSIQRIRAVQYADGLLRTYQGGQRPDAR